MILITGGSGYVGSHIVRRLAESGERVRVLVRDPERAAREGRLSDLGVETAEAEVTVSESVEKALHGATAVIHTVAIAIERKGQTYEATNFQGTVNVVDAAKAAGVKRFLHFSQLGADPDLPYRFLASKGRAQAYVADSGLEWTTFRPSVIWGPEDEFANTFARLAPFSPLIFPIVGDERARFQPVWIEDVATCVLKVLRDESTVGQTYELGGPEVLTLEEIERRALSAIGARRTWLRFPMPFLKAIVAAMEVLLPSPPVTRSLLELLAVSNVTEHNALPQFVSDPRPFTSDNVAPYMSDFTARSTLSQFLGK